MRLTSSVVVEVIRAARRSLLVVSFAAYGVTEVITELLAAAGRGVHVDLVARLATIWLLTVNLARRCGIG